MKVAVICEYSGTVRDAFIRAGHEAISFDIIPSDSDFGPHVIGDVMEIPWDYWKQFDLAICHPPCTYLSNAGAKHLFRGGVLNEERFIKGLPTKTFFMYLLHLPIERIAVENPIPSKIYGLPKYDQFVQPYEHGHPFQKKTCLWLKNLPKLEPTNIVDIRENTRQAGNWFNKGGKDRQKNRAKTFEGIAEAMATQWGGI
jgi:hypothetical protein